MLTLLTAITVTVVINTGVYQTNNATLEELQAECQSYYAPMLVQLVSKGYPSLKGHEFGVKKKEIAKAFVSANRQKYLEVTCSWVPRPEENK